MSVKRYRAKPVEIEAVQWTGTNWSEIQDFTGNRATATKLHVGASDERPIEIFSIRVKKYGKEEKKRIDIGDYVIKGSRNEFWVCRKREFTKKYEEVTE